MTKVALFAGGVIDSFHLNFDVFIGVDKGSFFLLQQGIQPDMAVGDFDSVSSEELDGIRLKVKKVIQVAPEKNDTDMELAVKMAFEYYPSATVTIFGALGGRLDHTLSNIFLPSNSGIAPYMKQICLVNSSNKVIYCPQGRHEVKPVEGMSYLGFMPVGNDELKIEGAKYPLNKTNFFFKKVYGSNEFIDKPVFLECTSGYVVIIYSKDGD